MTWPTHQAGAVVAALALDMPPLAVFAAFLGAVLPDMADQSLSRLAPGKRMRQKMFNRIHRGNSHWFGWWLLFFMLPLAFALPEFAREILAGFALGGLSHVMLDMFTPRGVPLLPVGPARNLAIPVCSTGKPGEYVILALLIAAGVFLLFSISPVKDGLLLRWAH